MDRTKEESNFDLPEWQQKVLDEEIAAIANDPTQLLKWDEVKSSILA